MKLEELTFKTVGRMSTGGEVWIMGEGPEPLAIVSLPRCKFAPWAIMAEVWQKAADSFEAIVTMPQMLKELHARSEVDLTDGGGRVNRLIFELRTMLGKALHRLDPSRSPNEWGKSVIEYRRHLGWRLKGGKFELRLLGE